MDIENKRTAAIDIGSNAIRMVIAEHSLTGIRVLKKFRIPIRLGEDVFNKGKISGKNLKAAARAFKSFSEICKKAKVLTTRAVGTSALRESKNGDAFCELIRRKTKWQIEIIDGVEEARLIHLAVSKELHLDGHRALLIDIGGGSVELTFSSDGQMSSTNSFPFGTVRTLQRLKQKNWDESHLPLMMSEYMTPLSHFLHSQISDKPLEFAIGTGGNLEALAKLKGQLLNKPNKTALSFEDLQMIIDRLMSTSIKDRIEKLKMRPDRADVILPAAMVVQTVLRQAGLQKIFVPHVGLRDGLLWSMRKTKMKTRNL